MIKELTADQKSKFQAYVDKWTKIGTSTEPTNMLETVKHIEGAYRSANLPPPNYIIGPVDGPYEAAVAEYILAEFVKEGTKFKDSTHLNKLVLEKLKKLIADGNPISNLSISNQIYGNQEYWLSYYDFFIRECGLNLERIQPLIELANHCGWWTPLKNVAIVQNRPRELHRDNQGRLHNLTGPAVSYGENSPSNVYAIGGVRVTRNIIDRKYTCADIDVEVNAEVRRVMIDLYGQGRYIADSGAEIVNVDDFGTLYKKDFANDEPMMMVKVINSTAEPDGTFKDYFIRVDPKAYGGLTTARAAVASTWRNNDAERTLVFKSPNDYDPSFQT